MASRRNPRGCGRRKKSYRYGSPRQFHRPAYQKGIRKGKEKKKRGIELSPRAVAMTMESKVRDKEKGRKQQNVKKGALAEAKKKKRKKRFFFIFLDLVEKKRKGKKEKGRR